ncbi:unnamed protein product, partial [Urochloa humidicola]
CPPPPADPPPPLPISHRIGAPDPPRSDLPALPHHRAQAPPLASSAFGAASRPPPPTPAPTPPPNPRPSPRPCRRAVPVHSHPSFRSPCPPRSPRPPIRSVADRGRSGGGARAAMDQSRRAVESCSRMVDGIMADDDKVIPVYKLEEICELLRASDASIVKEVAEFVLKRLDNKSPLVKQK